MIESEARRLRWEQRTGGSLTVLAVVFLVVYAVPILWPSLPEPVKDGCWVANYTIWGVFFVDYALRFTWAKPKGAFVRRTLLDLASVVLPVIRPLRALRLVRVIRVLDHRASDTLHGRVAKYIGASVALILFVAALAELDAERGNPKANITTFPDALWWAITTITTVGYGDRYPVTTEGRTIAVALMLAGIALLGVVTATVAAWFVDRVTEVRQSEAATQVQVAALHDEIRALRAQLDAQASPLVPNDGQPAS